MKNVLKVSLLGLGMTIAISGCGDGKKAQNVVDTGKVDSAKADVSAVKPDTTKADTVKK